MFSNPFKSISVKGHRRTQVKMDVYGWVFKIYDAFFPCSIPLFSFACDSLIHEHNNLKYCFFIFNRSVSNAQFFFLPNIFLQWYQKTEHFKIRKNLTLSRMRSFGGAHGWRKGGQKGLPFLKSVTHILQW